MVTSNESHVKTVSLVTKECLIWVETAEISGEELHLIIILS